MDDKLIAIRSGGLRVSDQRCRQTDCVFPHPTLRFDIDDRRIVTAWSWAGVRVLNVPNGVRVKVLPTLLLVPMSCN